MGKINSFLLTIFLFANFQISNCQTSLSPIKDKILLSGNFGELRSSGFHTGIDIKTKGKEGEIIRTIDDGFISRIQVSTVGYGKVIYITHHNGLISVYGHLSDFEKKIDSFAKKIQYSRKSFTFNKYFKKDEIIVKKGQVIGYSGNTGSSSGPHLHFEIRTKNNKPINPLKFNYKINDTINPVVKSIYVYSTKNKLIHKKKLNLNKINDTLYKIKLRTNDSIFFGVETFDKQNFSNNRNGTYNIKMVKKGVTLFNYKFDTLTFQHKNLPLKYYDHSEFKKNRSKIIILNDKKLNNYSFYKNKSDGIFKVKKGIRETFEIILSDYNRNKTYVIIEIENSEKEFNYTSIEEIFNKKINKHINYKIYLNGISLNFDKDTFYSNTSIDLDFKNDTLLVKNPNIILKNPYKVKFPNYNKNGSYVATFNGNNINYVSSEINGDYFEYKTKRLGKFFISIDTINPIIKNLNKKNIINDNKKIKFLIKDKETGIKKYTAKINNEWALFEHEPKKSIIEFKPDNFIQLKEENDLLIVVEDLLGNKTIYEDTFYYKP